MRTIIARIDPPLPVITLMPPEHGVFGRDKSLGELRAAPPRFVMLVHKDVSEYGHAPFGTEARYGKPTYTWIRARYHSIAGFGNTASAPSGYGIELLERN